MVSCFLSEVMFVVALTLEIAARWRAFVCTQSRLFLLLLDYLFLLGGDSANINYTSTFPNATSRITDCGIEVNNLDDEFFLVRTETKGRMKIEKLINRQCGN